MVTLGRPRWVNLEKETSVENLPQGWSKEKITKGWAGVRSKNGRRMAKLQQKKKKKKKKNCYQRTWNGSRDREIERERGIGQGKRMEKVFFLSINWFIALLNRIGTISSREIIKGRKLVPAPRETTGKVLEASWWAERTRRCKIRETHRCL